MPYFIRSQISGSPKLFDADKREFAFPTEAAARDFLRHTDMDPLILYVAKQEGSWSIHYWRGNLSMGQYLTRSEAKIRLREEILRSGDLVSWAEGEARGLLDGYEPCMPSRIRFPIVKRETEDPSIGYYIAELADSRLPTFPLQTEAVFEEASEFGRMTWRKTGTTTFMQDPGDDYALGVRRVNHQDEIRMSIGFRKWILHYQEDRSAYGLDRIIDLVPENNEVREWFEKYAKYHR
jgi:hypothetical protein